MKSTIAAMFVCEIPRDAVIGQEFTLSARARLTSLREEMVDASTMSEEVYLPGHTSYEMLLYDVELEL